MRSRLCRILVVGALLMGSGFHLAIVQSYAWATMAVSNLRTAGSVTQALERTFDGRHPCQVCLRVKKESESRTMRDAQRPEARRDLFFARAVFRLQDSVASWTLPSRPRLQDSFLQLLDPPPPRGLTA